MNHLIGYYSKLSVISVSCGYFKLFPIYFQIASPGVIDPKHKGGWHSPVRSREDGVQNWVREQFRSRQGLFLAKCNSRVFFLSNTIKVHLLLYQQEKGDNKNTAPTLPFQPPQ